MYKEFSHIEELINEVKADKNLIGSNSMQANRYPIRFVLFDNFRDSYEFVSEMQDKLNCSVESVNHWMENEYNDTILTHSKLAEKIKKYIFCHSSQDSVIAPFSELARFYDNKKNFEFDALVRTIKAIESTPKGFNYHQRVYIPIVGLEGKMSKFNEDSQIFTWYFKNPDIQLNYNLVLTNNTTYGIQNLESRFTIITNMQEWLKIWRDKETQQQILSTSRSLFANAEFAQPDNAFSFCVCNNVYDFLTKGLNIDFGTIEYKEKEENHWLRLAKKIVIPNFSFEKFFNRYFHIDDLVDFNVFLKTWFDCNDEFGKWLLTNYYADKFCDKGYICKAIKKTESLANYDFFAAIALAIFDLDNNEKYLEERAICLQQAANKNVVLNNESQDNLISKLQKLSDKEGFATAIRYFSPLTDAEKMLAIEWLGKGNVTKDEIKPFFPDLYSYLGKSFGVTASLNWVLEYTDFYKQSKISNNYSIDVDNIIHEKNKSSISFNNWYQDFRTTKTILASRSDIDIFYWIDGLGIDWIPFISELIDRENNIYINEIYISRAIYPTKTEINKPNLFDLSTKLEKIGDLDSHAHKQGNRYPNYIIEEIKIVENAIKQIINEYAGKKIAIVSDHGLTALSQLKSGLNMAGVESDHYGRIAVRKTGNAVFDNNYILLEDNKTMCALHHESLCAKVPIGQSAHGGCTPEEVFVPIFIISAEKNANTYAATLLTKNVSASNPVVRYNIKGLSFSDIPYVIYNNKRYELNQETDNIYISDNLELIANITEIELIIGSYTYNAQIAINLGAEEDDLFDF